MGAWWSDIWYEYCKRNSYLRKLDNKLVRENWIATQSWHLICLGDHTSQWNQSALWFSLLIFPVHPQLLRDVSLAVIIANKFFSNLQLSPVFLGPGVNTQPKLSKKNVSFIFGFKREIWTLSLQLLDFITMGGFFCGIFPKSKAVLRKWNNILGDTVLLMDNTYRKAALCAHHSSKHLPHVGSLNV